MDRCGDGEVAKCDFSDGFLGDQYLECHRMKIVKLTAYIVSIRMPKWLPQNILQ
jgi:hypothetical protein